MFSTHYNPSVRPISFVRPSFQLLWFNKRTQLIEEYTISGVSLQDFAIRYSELGSHLYRRPYFRSLGIPACVFEYQLVVNIQANTVTSYPSWLDPDRHQSSPYTLPSSESSSESTSSSLPSCGPYLPSSEDTNSDNSEETDNTPPDIEA